MAQFKEITAELVVHVASLARIELRADEIKEFQGHMAKVLAHVEELTSVPTDHVEPLFSPMRENPEFYVDGRAQRNDEVRPSLGTEKILRNAPQSELNQFKVEAVIEES